MSEEWLPDWEQDLIRVAQLRLDEMNYRIDEVDSERAAIHAIINEQGKKLVALATHMIKNGLAPGEFALVIPDDEEGRKDHFVVMEGNRRVTVLKLLEQPQLARDTLIHSDFVKLSKSFLKRPIRKIPCVVLADRDTARVWVEVKHSTQMNGAGVEKWGAPTMTRWEESKGQYRRWRIVIRFLKDQGIETSNFEKKLRKKTTAADRVFNARAMNAVLGVTFTKDGAVEFENNDQTLGCKLLEKMVRAMASPSWNTNDVHSFDHRVEFIHKFEKLNVKAVVKTNTSSPGQTGKGSGGDEGRTSKGDGTSKDGPDTSKPKGKSTKKKASDRKTLASRRKDYGLRIENERLNQLYHSAKGLDVHTHTATAAVIIRVFLELTCEHYLIEQNVLLPDHVKKRAQGRPISWSDHNVYLSEKIKSTLDNIDPKKKIDDLSEPRKSLSSDDNAHSPRNLHNYVHGLQTIPVPSELILIWDRFHPLYAHIFEELGE